MVAGLSFFSLSFAVSYLLPNSPSIAMWPTLSIPHPHNGCRDITRKEFQRRKWISDNHSILILFVFLHFRILLLQFYATIFCDCLSGFRRQVIIIGGTMDRIYSLWYLCRTQWCSSCNPVNPEFLITGWVWLHCHHGRVLCFCNITKWETILSPEK